LEKPVVDLDTEQMADLRAGRIAGALLGVHAGDALGAHLEFLSWADIRARYPDGPRDIVGGGSFGWQAGQPTDDTDLTRAVLLAYLTSPQDVVRAAADNMVDWLTGHWPGRTPGQPPKDVGTATASGLQRYMASRDPKQAGAGIGQAGNGSLMRCIPTALAVTDPVRRVSESVAISAITHNDPRCTAACAAYNEIAAALIDGLSPQDAVQAGLNTARELDADAVAGAIAYGKMLRPRMLALTGETHLETNGAGYVLDSLSLAVAAALDDRPLADVLVDIVRIGNDTDTNAAIAGGLLGARDGASAVPAKWLAVLELAEEFSTAARQLESITRT
jgi:ADP-ribosylglycohydrolase